MSYVRAEVAYGLFLSSFLHHKSGTFGFLYHSFFALLRHASRLVGLEFDSSRHHPILRPILFRPFSHLLNQDTFLFFKRYSSFLLLVQPLHLVS